MAPAVAAAPATVVVRTDVTATVVGTPLTVETAEETEVMTETPEVADIAAEELADLMEELAELREEAKLERAEEAEVPVPVIEAAADDEALERELKAEEMEEETEDGRPVEVRDPVVTDPDVEDWACN